MATTVTEYTALLDAGMGKYTQLTDYFNEYLDTMRTPQRGAQLDPVERTRKQLFLNRLQSVIEQQQRENAAIEQRLDQARELWVEARHRVQNMNNSVAEVTRQEHREINRRQEAQNEEEIMQRQNYR